MSQDSVNVKALGLVVEPNQLDQQVCPPGSMVVANDVIIKRDSVVEPRRGYQLYGTPLGGVTDKANQLFTYKERILVNYANKMAYDTLQLNSLGQSIIDNFCGNYLPPIPGRRMRSIEMNGNFYFTTNQGIYKISARTAADFTTACPYIVPAGGIAALDISTRLDGSPGFLPPDSAVSYEVLWGYNDANSNEILGTPSNTSTIYNPLSATLLSQSNNLYLQLDYIGNNTAFPSLITDTNFFALYNLPANASPAQMQANLIALATQLDNNILYADQVHVAPLQIAGAYIGGGIATVSFSSGNPASYFFPGSLIKLLGFTTATGTINYSVAPPGSTTGTVGGQSVTSIIPAVSSVSGVLTQGSYQTSEIFTRADLNNNLGGTYWTIWNANNTTQYYIWYNVNGNGVNPGLPNATGIEIGLNTNDTAQSVATKTSTTLTNFTSDFTSATNESIYTITNIAVAIGGASTVTTSAPHGLVTGDPVTITGSNSTPVIDGTQTVTYVSANQFSVPVNVTVSGNAGSVIVDTVTVTNSAYGASNNSSSGTTGFNIINTAGTSGDVVTSINTTGINVGVEVTDTSGFIPVNTFVTAVGLNQITLSNDVTGSGTENLNFDAAITFNTTATGPVTTSDATINSNYYESIAQPGVPSVPPTDDQLVALQTYLESLVTGLQSELPTVISTNSQENFISTISISNGGSVNVYVTITIPPGVTTSDFFQIYRSPIAQATGAQVLATDIFPSNELQLVYEAYPTAAQIAAGTITVLDITPPQFAGAYLYTNEQTGQGILQENNIPPLSIDIALYKNVVFYANTQTLFTASLNLLGIQQLILDYGTGLDVQTFGPGAVNTSTSTITITNHGYSNGQSVYITNPVPADLPGGIVGSLVYYIVNATTNTFQLSLTQGGAPISITTTGSGTNTIQNMIPTLTITDGTVTTTYTFVLGLPEIATITTVADVSGSLAGKYFTINSGGNFDQYYFYYIVSGVGSDPMLTGLTGVPVYLNTNDSADVVATKTANAINVFNTDFFAAQFVDITSISVANPTVITTNIPHGLSNGDIITINGSNSTPIIDGQQTVTVTGVNTFTIPVNVTVAGTTGSFTTPTINQITVSTVDSGYTTAPSAGTSGFSIAVTQSGVGANPALKQILLSSNPSPAQAVAETAQSIVAVINAQSGGNVEAFYVSSVQGVPGQIVLQAVALGQNPFYIQVNDSNVGLSFNPNISPDIFISNIAVAVGGSSVITTSTPHGFVNKEQVVISASNSTPSIDGLYTITYINSTQFSIPSSVTVAGNFGAVTAASNTLVSTNLVKGNRIYYSKINQPEAVPAENFIDVGFQDKAILRIFTLRDSLFVYKEDGLFRISGQSAPFTLDVFDVSCILVAPDSLDVSNNLIYGFTRQGIVTTTESGTSIISRPIDTVILPLLSEQYTNFDTATWGIGYESDNSYTFYTIQSPTDIIANIGYRYSNLTNTWTNFIKTNTCGVINDADDTQYLGAGDVDFLEQERKNFDRTDYADRQYTENLAFSDFQGLNMILPSQISLVDVGDVITQDQYMSVYNYNGLLSKLDTDLTLSHNYETDYTINTGVDPREVLDLLIKAIANDQVRLGQPIYTPITDYTQWDAVEGIFNITNISASDPSIITVSTDHLLQTGRSVTIVGTNSTPVVDGIYQVTVLTPTTFSIPIAVTQVGDTGTYVVNNENFLDIETSFNGLISTLNADPAVTYANYNPIVNDTLLEAIVTNVNYNLNTVTLNNNLQWLTGPITIYKAINSQFQYSPISMGDPLNLKHFSDALMFFENTAFTNAVLSFSSDLQPAFNSVPFYSTGNGIFGYTGIPSTFNGNTGTTGFGYGYFGGGGNAAPFRTIIPRLVQRCRFLNIAFQHQVAREKFSTFGINVVGNNTGSVRIR